LIVYIGFSLHFSFFGKGIATGGGYASAPNDLLDKEENFQSFTSIN
jgi:hypothetical protein